MKFQHGLRLEDCIGPPSKNDIFNAMMLEHYLDSPFLRVSGEVLKVLGKAGYEVVNPKAEWSITVSGKAYSTNDTPKIKKREITQPLQQYIDYARGNFPDLHLCEAEIVALRLWTGPMYKRYTFLLRSHCGNLCLPCHVPVLYVTTVHAFNSGIVKLSRRQATRRSNVVYRGLASASAPRTGIDGVEPSPLAFSTDRAVAEGYARGSGGLLLEFDLDATKEGRSGELAAGADICWLSQFPHEREVLFPALSLLQSVGEPLRLKSGGWVWSVRVVACVESRTLEEMGVATDDEVQCVSVKWPNTPDHINMILKKRFLLLALHYQSISLSLTNEMAFFTLHNDTLYLSPPFFLLFCTRAIETQFNLMILFINYCSARYNSVVFSVLLLCLHSNLHTRTLRPRFVSPPHIGLMLCLSIFLSLFRTKKRYSSPSSTRLCKHRTRPSPSCFSSSILTPLRISRCSTA